MSELSFAPTALDLEVTPGDPLDVTIPLTTAAGEDADLSPYAAEADVLGVVSGVRTVATCTISGASVRVQLTAAQTAALDEVGLWDLCLTAAGAVVATPVAGVLRAARHHHHRLRRPGCPT